MWSQSQSRAHSLENLNCTSHEHSTLILTSFRFVVIMSFFFRRCANCKCRQKRNVKIAFALIGIHKISTPFLDSCCCCYCWLSSAHIANILLVRKIDWHHIARSLSSKCFVRIILVTIHKSNASKSIRCSFEGQQMLVHREIRSAMATYSQCSLRFNSTNWWFRVFNTRGTAELDFVLIPEKLTFASVVGFCGVRDQDIHFNS